MNSCARIAVCALCLSALGACEVAREEYPAHWPELVEAESNACPDLSGVFQNRPTRVLSDAATSASRSLSLADLLIERRIQLLKSSDYRHTSYILVNSSINKVIISDQKNNIIKDYNEIFSGQHIECKNGKAIIDIDEEEEGLTGGFGELGYTWIWAEIFKNIENDLAVRIVIGTVGLFGFVVPGYADDEHWLLFEDISRQERECNLPNGTIEVLTAESCLAATGRIVVR